MADTSVLWVLQQFDQGITTYINQTSAALCSSLAPIVAAGLTAWVAAFGLATIRGETQEPFTHLLWSLCVKSMYLSVALGVGSYQVYVVNVVWDAVSSLSSVVIGANTGACPVTAGIDGLWGPLSCLQIGVSNLVVGYFATGGSYFMALSPLNAIACWFAGIIIFIGCETLVMVLTIETIFAKASIGLILGLGPIFVAAGAFEVSKSYFDRFVSVMVGSITVCVVMIAVAALGISLYQKVLDTGVNPLKINLGTSMMADILSAISNQITGNSGANVLLSAIQMCVIALIIAFIALRAPSIAHSLAGDSHGGSGWGAAAAVVAGKGLFSQLRKKKDKNAGGSVTEGKNKNASDAGAQNNKSATQRSKEIGTKTFRS